MCGNNSWFNIILHLDLSNKEDYLALPLLISLYLNRVQFAVKIAAQQKEMEELKTGGLGPYVQALHPHSDLENLPLHTLKALQSQLRQDLESVEKV